MKINNPINQDIVKLVVTNLNGTLTKGYDNRKILEESFKIHQLKLTEKHYDKFHSAILKLEELARMSQITINHYSRVLDEFFPILREKNIDSEEFRQTLFDREIINSEVDPNIKELLRVLSEKYKIICVSNWFKEPEEGKLTLHDLYRYIHRVYTYENKGFRIPSIECSKAIRREYNVENSEVLILGDSMSDARFASTQGYQFVVFDYYHTNQKDINDKANIVVNSSEELLRLLK